jgi:hypothetical protein
MEGIVVHLYQVKSSKPGTLVVKQLSSTSYRADMTFTGANIQDLTLGIATGDGPGTVYLTVIDNGEPGSNGSTTDQVLITIKDKNKSLWYTSDVTANNAISNYANSTNIPILNRGNIQVRTGCVLAYSANTEIYQTVVSALTVSAYPNPFNDKVQFSIESPVTGKASLVIYNIMGQKLHAVYEGYLFAGKGQVIDYNVPAAFQGSLIYTLRVGDQQVNGKLLKIK